MRIACIYHVDRACITATLMMSQGVFDSMEVQGLPKMQKRSNKPKSIGCCLSRYCSWHTQGDLVVQQVHHS